MVQTTAVTALLNAARGSQLCKGALKAAAVYRCFCADHTAQRICEVEVLGSQH